MFLQNLINHSRILCGGLLLFVMVASSHLEAQNSHSSEIQNKIKEVENNLNSGWYEIEGEKNWNLQERMKYYKANGVSIAVINNYKIEWTKGYGYADVKEQRKVTTNTRFMAGSISKSLNAMGVLRLAEEMKLDINADINLYLKSWKFPYDSISNGSIISLADLLAHTSGINTFGWKGIKRTEKVPSIYDILNGKDKPGATPIKSETTPGKYHYSGGASLISQLIINDLTGMPYDAFMKEKVFDPLNMENSSFTQPPPRNVEKNLATGYYNDGNAVEGKYYLLPQMAAGGLWTTPTDLAKYIIETQLSYKGLSNKILSTEMTRKRFFPLTDSSIQIGHVNKNNASGLGIYLDIEKNGKPCQYFWHGGGIEGFYAHYYGSFDGKGVVIMLNLHYAFDGGKLAREILNSVSLVYGWENFVTRVPKKPLVVTDSLRKKYVGTYKSKSNNRLTTIYLKDHKLWLDTYNDFQAPSEILFTSEADFFNREQGSDKTFLFDSLGKVKGYRKIFNGNPEIVERIDLFKHSASSLKKFVGSYIEENQKIEITTTDGGLLLNSHHINFISETEFYLSEDNLSIYTFIINEKNEVKGYKRTNGFDVFVGSKL